MKIVDFLLFRLNAKNEYNIHSPFLFDLYNTVLKSNYKPSFINVLSDIKSLFFRKKKSTLLPFGTSIPKRYENIVFRLLQKFCFTSIVLVSFREGPSPIYTVFCRKGNHFEKVLESTDLTSVYEITPALEMVFFDKTYELEYNSSVLNELFSHVSKKSIFVFEIPHSSEKNLLHFEKITPSERITLSLNLYFIGISFFNPSLSKQRFWLKV